LSSYGDAVTETAAAEAATWRALLGPKHLGASTVLAGGVALYSTNEFLTVSLLPSAVAEIGGQRLYAWVTTVYLVASVVTATMVNPILVRLGPRRSYLLALSVLIGGSVACALAPNMGIMLVGRIVQGAAGGLVAGLGYAVINAALPQSLWIKGSALVSAMWGVGILVGPAMGGLFAQFGSWRWAFGALAILTVAMTVLVPIALPGRSAEESADATGTRLRIPVWSLLLLGCAAFAVSVAGIPRNLAITAGLLIVGAILVGLFLVVDRRARVSVLPATAFRPGPLKWMYLTLGLLMAATMVDMYVPLFGQRLAHLEPVVAGFLGVAVSIGWTAGELTSASIKKTARSVRAVTVAPLVMAVGLGGAALSQVDNAAVGAIVIWAVALVIAGTGVGMAWPHLSAWAMGSVDDPTEGGTAAAAISTVQLICGAFGAGLAGVIVNMTDRGDVTAPRWLFGTFAVLVAFGCIASYRASRGRETQG
jgi:MFS family permease